MKYNPSMHAIERIRDRFGIMEEHAKNFVNQLMETALYVSTNPNGTKVYKHTGKDVMLAIDPKNHVVITILPPQTKENVINTLNPLLITSLSIRLAQQSTAK